MSGRAIRVIIILGVISIIGIISIQIYFIQKSFDIKDKQLDQSIHIILRNVAEAICSYNNTILPYENPVFRQTSDYYIVDINSVINAEVLEHSLTTELQRRNLELDYEYAIYDCETNAMVYGDYVKLSGGNKEVMRDYSLPACNDYVYYFGVHFPGRKEYLIRTMGIWLFFSIILLVVIVFFGYTQYVILQQRRLSEIQKDFIDNMTHELKTPLTSITLSADVLADPSITEEPARLRDYAEIIRNQSEFLQNHIENVLQMAGTGKKYHTLKKEIFDLHEFIAKIAQDTKPKIEETGGKIRTKLEAESSCIYADKFHLTNVLLNILDNSIKYSKHSSEISISTKTVKGKIQMTVSDNGIGIPHEYQQKVFNRFFRVPSGNVHNIKGFGLGLTYVKKISDLHHWKSRVRSDGKTGTVIYFIIRPVK
ncbi:MAG: HAMP domain-containing histidine kinase [Bacteroidales bacterium]|nr:MAG: HAMP domain-containing histidine kinase [Bacteroidales bacterium]